MNRKNLKFGNEAELANYLQTTGSARIKSITSGGGPNSAAYEQAQVERRGRHQRPATVPEQPAARSLALETGKTGLIRQGDKDPNMTERRFEIMYIKPRYNLPIGSAQAAFAVHHFERHRLRLANGCWYKPDWWVRDVLGGIHVYEIKGRDYVWERTKTSVKLAAERYPEYNFYLCVEDFGGQWLVERVKS